MTVDRLSLGMKKVLVGIGLDDHAKELLDWAVVKVADSGDSVVAIHVCRNSDSVASKKKLLDGYLEDYGGICNAKQVVISAEVLKGNSIRKVLVREARNRSASAVVTGIAKHSGFGGWDSMAKYCAKRLSPSTEIMAIDNGKVVFSRCSKIMATDNGKVVFSRCSNIPLEDRCLDPKPSFCTSSMDDHSMFGESLSESGKESNIIKNVIISPIQRKIRGSLSSISLPAEDFTKQRPGWPLLHTSISLTPAAHEARNMSVVQWVMTLPRKSPLSEISESNSHARFKTQLPKDLESILMRNSVGCRIFDHGALKMSSSEFPSGNLIGKGGSNSVYKGLLPEGKTVAIKILKSSKEALKFFTREVDIMTTLKHEKIAPLLGVSMKDNDLISVYDFMSKGNLEENISGNGKGISLLSWESRFRIALGIAEGLNYLHNECPRPVIHRDIKSSNILLTDELEPQLYDFGLAIWGPTTTSFLNDSDIVGTFGYLAPEYFMYGKVSDKIDVYAFGVVLLELLSGKKPIGLETDKGREILVTWAKPHLQNRDFKSILDPNLDGLVDESQMERMALAAASCLTRSSRLRPKMFKVLNILKGEGYVDEREDAGCDDYDDDEVYPDSSAESHLSLALLDVNGDSTSFSSPGQSSPLSVEEYLKKR